MASKNAHSCFQGHGRVSRLTLLLQASGSVTPDHVVSSAFLLLKDLFFFITLFQLCGLSVFSVDGGGCYCDSLSRSGMPSPFANFHFSPAGCSYEGAWREGESREVDGVQGCCDCIQALSPASCLNSDFADCQVSPSGGGGLCSCLSCCLSQREHTVY